VPHCEDERIGILIFGAGCCGLHTAGERHALQKINDVTIMQHNSVPLCPALHHKKRGRQSRRPRQLCQFRTFSCVSAVYKSYSGTALPQRARSRPHPPCPPAREVGTTFPLNHGVSVHANRLPARIFRAVASPILVSSSSRWSARCCGCRARVEWGSVVVGQSRRATAVKTTPQRACPPPREGLGGVRPI
jgi:hypothetical protein